MKSRLIQSPRLESAHKLDDVFVRPGCCYELRGPERFYQEPTRARRARKDRLNEWICLSPGEIVMWTGEVEYQGDYGEFRWWVEFLLPTSKRGWYNWMGMHCYKYWLEGRKT